MDKAGQTSMSVGLPNPDVSLQVVICGKYRPLKMLLPTNYTVGIPVAGDQQAPRPVQSAMCNVQCAMSNVQCAMFNVQCTLSNVQCAKFHVQCAMVLKYFFEKNDRISLTFFLGFVIFF